MKVSGYFLVLFVLMIICILSSGAEHPKGKRSGRKIRNNRWIAGVKNPLASQIAPPFSVNPNQDGFYNVLSVGNTLESTPVDGLTISRFVPTSSTGSGSASSPRFELVDEERNFDPPIKPAENEMVKYEDVQAFLEQFLNSKLDMNNNMDVITQAFRFVKLDSHLEALARQLRKLEESHDRVLRVTTTQETKFDLLMEQMGKLASSISSETNKLKGMEERLESEIATMNHRIESAVEKIIISSATSQIMLDLSKESLQQMDRLEGTGNQVLSSLKTLKTELGDVGQASIQVIYNVQKSEETLMRALAETGNRTIYALRQEQSASAATLAGIGGSGDGTPAETLEDGKLGNFIQADDAAATATKVDDDDGNEEGKGLRFGPHKKSFVSCSTQKRLINGQPKDCAEVQLSGYGRSGIYKIYPFENSTQMMEVYCDLESVGGGWTVIQRREDNQVPRESFFRTWQEYEKGFGSPQTHLWLGLRAISALSGSGEQTLRIELGDWDGETKDANYGYFRVANASELYRLHIADFTGSAGDSLAYHNGMAFSTKDKDNDLERGLSCASRYQGGWWFRNCHQSNLNGKYFEGRGRQEEYATGVNWYTWHGYYYSLKSTEMKIRPRNFRRS